MEIFRFFLFFIVTLIGLCNCNVIPEVENKTIEDYEVNPDLYQGDIELSEKQKKEFFGDEENQKNKRTGLIDTRYRWPKNAQGNVILPYVLDNAYSKWI
jgi:hypothetical protein